MRTNEKKNHKVKFNGRHRACKIMAIRSQQNIINCDEKWIVNEQELVSLYIDIHYGHFMPSFFSLSALYHTKHRYWILMNSYISVNAQKVYVWVT